MRTGEKSRGGRARSDFPRVMSGFACQKKIDTENISTIGYTYRRTSSSGHLQEAATDFKHLLIVLSIKHTCE